MIAKVCDHETGETRGSRTALSLEKVTIKMADRHKYVLSKIVKN